jgi:hypothetical protein
MSNSDFVRTTFIYRQEKLWKFRQIAMLKRKKIRDVTCKMMDYFIEDYEDSQLRVRLERMIKEATKHIEWNDLKRSMKLDELQDFT